MTWIRSELGSGGWRAGLRSIKPLRVHSAARCAILAHMDAVGTQEELGQRVRQARLARSMDQTALGKAAGLDRTAISKIESGARGVSALELTRIAVALRLTIPDLVFTPSAAVLSGRTSLADLASGQESSRFDAETALDTLARDAEQLRDLGHLPTGIDVEEVRWASVDDALALAGRLREMLQIGTAPLGPMADLCARFGLWIAPIDAEVDGLSATSSPGFGVAVVGSGVPPGRRRATAAHELGHHLSGDEYSVDLSVSASHEEREQLIETFAAELLLPSAVCLARISGLEGSLARLELVRVCAEYRVSWSLAVRTLRRAASQRYPAGTQPVSIQYDLAPYEATPTDGDFLEAYGSKPEPDLQQQTMAAKWVQACMAAFRADDITPTRAAEMMRSASTAADLR